MNIQSLTSDFFSNLQTFETGNHFSFSEYFSIPCSELCSLAPAMPDLLCYQHISVSAPFSYTLSHVQAYCMLLTTRGCGQLEYQEQLYTLDEGTFVFLDCSRLHRIGCPRGRWEYTICFITTPVTAFYYEQCCPEHHCIFKPDAYSNLKDIWNQLFKETKDDKLHAILRGKTLTQLFTELYLIRQKENSQSFHTPAYLLDMKKTFDTACEEPFSLEEASRKYRINKYRLCREFSAHYQTTPLQYLNQVRIQRAKELLLTTDEKVCDIGQLVGIENTNHFIRLFKEKTGVTPLAFRRETPILDSDTFN